MAAGLTFSDAHWLRLKNESSKPVVHPRTETRNRSPSQLTTLLAMLDQFALSMLSHLPEIPEAQRKQALASGAAAPSWMARRGRGDAQADGAASALSGRRRSVENGETHDCGTTASGARLDELLSRQLGSRIIAAIGDPKITEIIVNEDGRVWFESYGKGMHEAGLTLAASQVESLSERSRRRLDPWQTRTIRS